MNEMAFDAAAVTAVIGYTDRILALLPQLRRFGVLVSCVLGVMYAISLRPGKHEIVSSVSSGIMIGLASSGGFAGMKSVVNR
jgi:hypothetical protein